MVVRMKKVSSRNARSTIGVMSMCVLPFLARFFSWRPPPPPPPSGTSAMVLRFYWLPTFCGTMLLKKGSIIDHILDDSRSVIILNLLIMISGAWKVRITSATRE